MNFCLKVPRMFLPRENFEDWAVPADEDLPSGGTGRLVRAEGPSAYRFLLSAWEGEDPVGEIREAMYSALENDEIEKLNRGLILTERTTKTGTMYGIVACIDLEEYDEDDDEAPIRPAQRPVKNQALLELRRRAPLEFPHCRIFYRNKSRNIVQSLLEEDLEVCYDFELMGGGGRIVGRFFSEDLALDVLTGMHVRKPPCFLVADGLEEVAAAKARWEELKPTLRKGEAGLHPARFCLAELVNLYEDDVQIFPVHRILRETEPEVFLDFYRRNVKCSVEGNRARCLVKDPAAAVRKTDEIIAEYLRCNGGRVEYTDDLSHAGEDAAVVFQGPVKGDLFSHIRKGPYPAHTFVFGKRAERRYLLEGREICYD